MIRWLSLVAAVAVSVGAVELVPTLIAEDTRIENPAQQSAEPLEEKHSLNGEGIEIFGPAAQTGAFAALDVEPGIIIETQDAFGLGEVDARDRGTGSNFMALSVEGVPNYSIRPIGPRQNLYDLENMARIDHYRGALDPASGPGVGSKAGLVDLRWRRPSKEAGGMVAARTGSEGFYKLYARAESGEFGETWRAFVSVSGSSADKWKGEGELGPRTNVAAGIVNDGKTLPLELFVNHTTQKRHDFMGLTYAQTQNLSAYGDADYQSSDPDAPGYYDYYKRDLRYDEAHLSLKQPCGAGECRLKLYGADYLEKSDEGNGKGTVDARRIGARLTLNQSTELGSGELGIWVEWSWLEKYVEKVAADSTRAHQGWKWLNKNHGPDELLSPYVRLGTQVGALRLQGGLRYLYYKAAANDTYLGNNPESDYDDAITNGTIAPGGAVGAQTYRAWLPTLGLRYTLGETNELFAKWGRGYQRPYRYSFAAKYAANAGGIRDALLAAGEDLESVVEQWEMETSDLFDVGMRSYTENMEWTLTLFYHRHYDLLSTAYDPTLGIDYLQNVGDATVYGAELQSSIEPTEGVWLYLNPAWMIGRLNDNLEMGGSPYTLEGNAIPEMPRWTVKFGGTYRVGETQTLALAGRYVGSRYADVENEERVRSYTTADLRYAYRFRSETFGGDMNLFAEVLNLTDKTYVSGISSVDVLDDTSAYYVGAPRSFMIGMEGRF